MERRRSLSPIQEHSRLTGIIAYWEDRGQLEGRRNGGGASIFITCEGVHGHIDSPGRLSLSDSLDLGPFVSVIFAGPSPLVEESPR